MKKIFAVGAAALLAVGCADNKEPLEQKVVPVSQVVTGRVVKVHSIQIPYTDGFGNGMYSFNYQVEHVVVQKEDESLLYLVANAGAILEKDCIIKYTVNSNNVVLPSELLTQGRGAVKSFSIPASGRINSIEYR